MAVSDCTIRFKCFVCLAESICKIRFSSCTADAGCRIDYDRILVDKMILKERSKSDQGACGIASRVCYELCCLKCFPVEFGDSVNRFIKEFRIRMSKLIRFLVSSKILISEVSAVIDYLCACLKEFGNDLCRNAVGKSCDNKI